MLDPESDVVTPVTGRTALSYSMDQGASSRRTDTVTMDLGNLAGELFQVQYSGLPKVQLLIDLLGVQWEKHSIDADMALPRHITGALTTMDWDSQVHYVWPDSTGDTPTGTGLKRVGGMAINHDRDLSRWFHETRNLKVRHMRFILYRRNWDDFLEPPPPTGKGKGKKKQEKNLPPVPDSPILSATEYQMYLPSRTYEENESLAFPMLPFRTCDGLPRNNKGRQKKGKKSEIALKIERGEVELSSSESEDES